MTTDERIQRLERSNQRLQVAIMIIIIVLGTGFILGSNLDVEYHDVLFARQIHIVDGMDESAKTLMTLGPLFRTDSTEEDKHPGWGVYIYDSSGQQVVSLEHSFHVLTQLTMRNTDGVECTTLWPSRLWLNNDEHEKLVSIGAFKTGGEVYLSSSESEGKGVAMLSCSAPPYGQGQMVLSNSEGQDCVSLNATSDGVGRISTYDGGGNLILRVGTTENGEAAIATFNRAGKVSNLWP